MQVRSPGTATALRSLSPGSRRRTHAAHFVRLRSNSRGESVVDALRADPRLPLLVAPEIAPAGHRPPRAETLVCISRKREERFDLTQGFALAEQATTVAAKVRPGRWQCASSALRSARLLARAQSAHQKLTCRRMFERSEQSERSEFGDGPEERCNKPGHKQSSGLFVPGECPGHWPGPEGSRRTRRPPKRSADAFPGAPLPLDASTQKSKVCTAPDRVTPDATHRIPVLQCAQMESVPIFRFQPIQAHRNQHGITRSRAADPA